MTRKIYTVFKKDADVTKMQTLHSLITYKFSLLTAEKLVTCFNPLNAELNPICHLLALLGGETIVAVSRLRVNV